MWSRANSCAASASFLKFSRSLSRFDSEGISDWVIRVGIACGVKPCIIWNGKVLVTECVCELCANLRSGSASIQLFGVVPQ